MRIPRNDKIDFASKCRTASDHEIVGIYEHHKKEKRRPLARIAKAEATRRGIDVSNLYGTGKGIK